MKLRITPTLSLLSTLFALACGAAPPEEVGDVSGNVPGETDIGQTTQALGAFTTIFSGPAKDTLLHQGPLYVVFGRHRLNDGCGLVSAVRHDTGAETIRAFPSCLTNATAAVSDSSEVFVGHQSPVGISKLGSSGMIQVITPATFPTGKMLIDATFVYWSDNTGIHRAKRAGSSVSTVKSGSGKFLLGMDGSTIYFQQTSSGTNAVDLFSMPSSGGTATKLATESDTIFDFSFDGTNLYWLTDLDATGLHMVRRLSKSGGTPTTIASATDKDYGFPLSNGSMLYWLQEGPPGSIIVRRKNLSNGNVIVSPDTFDRMPASMRLTSSYLAAVESGSPGWLVKKGDL